MSNIRSVSVDFVNNVCIINLGGEQYSVECSISFDKVLNRYIVSVIAFPDNFSEQDKQDVDFCICDAMTAMTDVPENPNDIHPWPPEEPAP